MFALSPERDLVPAMPTKGQGCPVEDMASAKALGQKGVWSAGPERMTGQPELRDDGEVG